MDKNEVAKQSSKIRLRMNQLLIRRDRVNGWCLQAGRTGKCPGPCKATCPIAVRLIYIDDQINKLRGYL